MKVYFEILYNSANTTLRFLAHCVRTATRKGLFLPNKVLSSCSLVYIHKTYLFLFVYTQCFDFGIRDSRMSFGLIDDERFIFLCNFNDYSQIYVVLVKDGTCNMLYEEDS